MDDLRRMQILGIVLAIVVLFVFGGNFSGMNAIILKKIIFMLVTGILSVLAFLSLKKGENEKHSDLIFFIIMVVATLYIGGGLISDLIEGPQTTIITNCYIGEDRVKVHHNYTTKYYLCGTSTTEGLLQFPIDYEDVKFFNIENDIEVTYYNSTKDIIEFKNLY